MKIEIMDWKKERVSVDVGEKEDIKRMEITILSGDEILTVHYKNGDKKNYDSSNDRMAPFYDGRYEIYNEDEGVDLLEDQEWLQRTSSYDW